MFKSFTKSFRSGIAVIFSSLLALLSMLQNPIAPITKKMPTIPEEFKPVLRFAVASDIHNRTQRLADMIDTCYALAQEDEQYRSIDAFCFAGDFTNSGTNEEMQAIKDVFDAHINYDESQLVNIMGNHEFSSDGETARERYEKIFGVTPEIHTVVKGFHFIGLSYSNGSAYSYEAFKQTRQSLKEAQSDDSSKPIFTLQHPHNNATVYGSISWGTSSTNSLWTGHNRVMNFSGHSHFPIGDPRSIWQGSYTALGTGTLDYFELENELKADYFPDGYKDAAQFYIVEVDSENRIAVKCYDLLTRTFFGEEYFIENINDKSTYAYTYKNRKKYDDAPVFDASAKVSVEKNEDNEYIVSFDRAEDKFIVHDYKVTICSSHGKKVYSGSFISDYYRVVQSDTFACNLGEQPLEQGKEYTVNVTAANAYYELSNDISTSFTA